MQESELALHVSAADTANCAVCAVRIKDAFLNYSLSDELKTGLKDVCCKRIAAGTRAFVFDLGAVTVMDSCGLSVLISLKKFVEGEGATLCLIGLSPMMERLFAITKLDRVFEIHADERTAVAVLAQPA